MLQHIRILLDNPATVLCLLLAPTFAGAFLYFITLSLYARTLEISVLDTG